MKTTRIFSAIAAALAITTASGFAKDAVNTKCPVKGEDGADRAVTVEIGVCCEKCKAKIEADPGAYLAKAAKADDGKCPLSGKAAAEKAKVVINVCCGGCEEKLTADPKKFLGDVAVAKKDAGDGKK